MVLSSVVVHGISIPMIEFIPRAHDFTKTRSLTFTHPSQTFVAAENSNGTPAAPEGNGKLLWNPVHEAYTRARSIVLFWRPDSFWRYPKPAEPARGVDKDTIASPKDARAQMTVPDRAFFPSVSMTDKLDHLTTDEPHPREVSTVTFALGQGSSTKVTAAGDREHEIPADFAPPEEDVTRASVTPEGDSDPESLGAGTKGTENDGRNRGEGLTLPPPTANVRPPPPELVLPK